MNSLANTLKKYLEEQTKIDTAFAAVYDESKINDCASYVTKQAQKIKTGNYAFVEDAVVFKWSRDFYYGDIDNSDVAETTTTEKPMEIETKEATVIQQKKPTKKVVEEKATDPEEDKWDMCLFADLSEEEERGSNNA